MSLSRIAVKKDRLRRPQNRRELETSSYFPQVIEKLRGHPSFQSSSEQQLAELVERVTKPHELASYFSLTQDLDTAEQKAEVEALEVQLVLRHLTHKVEGPDDIQAILLQEYGPLQAYLVIGDMVLEWDYNSVVVPWPCAKDAANSSANPAGMGDVRESELPSIRVEQLKSKVLELVSRYNRMYYYHVIKRNAHSFVCNILEEMNISDPPQMQSKLKDYLNTLERSASTSIPKQFDTHTELDQYVEEHGQQLLGKEVDMEFLIMHYFMSHMVSKMKHRDPKKWECTEPNCKMKVLEMSINQKKMLLNKFRTVKYNIQESTAF